MKIAVNMLFIHDKQNTILHAINGVSEILRKVS